MGEGKAFASAKKFSLPPCPHPFQNALDYVFMKYDTCGIFIAGTSTNVGKTVVTAALSRALYMAGQGGHIPVKPVQTGIVHTSDADVSVYSAAHAGFDIAPTHAPRTLFSYALPASPHLAAAQEGQRLRCQDIVHSLAAHKHGPLLVEGAGGLFVPINAQESMLDVMQALAFPVVLVMQNTLGALNHTLLSLEALRQRNLPLLALVCVDTDGQGAKEALVRTENIRYLRDFLPDILIIEMPFVADLAENSIGAWGKVAQPLLPLAQKICSLWEEKSLQDACSTEKCKEQKEILPSLQPFQQEELSSLLDWDKSHLWHPYTSAVAPLPVYPVSHAKGVHIYLQDGRALVDGMSSWWCAIHGYGHEALIQACQEQAQNMAHVMFGGLTHTPAVKAAQKLFALLPTPLKALQRLFWADSGSVAVEVALKMALQYQQGKEQRTKILSPRGGYYGDTLGAMSVCDPINGMHSLFNHVLPQHIFIERPACSFDGNMDTFFDSRCLEELETVFAAQGEHLAACILEPIVQGAGGMHFYHPRYVQRVRQLCDAYGVLLICDEIATGFGRTGKLFACEWAHITPDILCVGKALTGGFMTLAATLCTQEVAEGICQDGNVFMHGPTFMANPLACAVAAAALDVLVQNPWQTRVERIAAELQAGLAPCKSLTDVKDVRVLGAIGVVEMQEPVNMVTLQAFFVEQGVWIRPFGKLIYVMPPYIATTDDIEKLCKAIVQSIEEKKYM